METIQLTDVMFSASDLIKKSAKQILFLRNRKERVTTGMIRGTEYQAKVVEKLNAFAEEMRGTFSKDNIIIFYTNDMIKDDIIYEVKMVDEERDTPDWYRESSILQAVFYKSLLMSGNGILTTPSFRIKEGYDSKTIKVPIDSSYRLLFGEEEYKIEVLDKDKIINYFIRKANATFDWSDAELYDYDHKFKHFTDLKKYFKFKRIN
jgi:hypothetical protein